MTFRRPRAKLPGCRHQKDQQGHGGAVPLAQRSEIRDQSLRHANQAAAGVRRERIMKKTSYAIILLLMAAAFLAGEWYSRSGNSSSAATEVRKILYYHDPMHPAYKSDKPGIAPDCGMQLEPVYADDPASNPSAGQAPQMPPGSVQVSASRQQLIGVQVAAATRVPEKRTVRILGRVAPDETRVYRINSATDGWVREIMPVTTGSLVKKDELLAKIYAPESFSAMKAYLYGLRSLDRFQASGKETKEQLEQTDANIENYRNGLRNQGMSEYQLDEIMRTRQGANLIEVRAPAPGFVLARNVTLGQRFDRGSELYRIGDLSRVWILADVFQTEEEFLRPGTVAKVTQALRQKSFPARVCNVLPQFDPATRTLKVRLEADNPGYALRPDMFVDVELPIRSQTALTVHAEAVLDTGLHKTVYVDRGNGFFEPRRVETGWRSGDRVEIKKGLEEGERIVASGNFLIDSESRLQLAARSISADQDRIRGSEAGARSKTATDPACGMKVDISTPAAIREEYGGATYYFCSSFCRDNFLKAPAKYLRGGQGYKTDTSGSRGTPTQVVAFGSGSVR